MPSLETRACALPRPYSRGELAADAIVHAAALAAGAVAFPLLFARAPFPGGAGERGAVAVYAVAFFLLFGFSGAYNLAPPSRLKTLLRRCDHSAIYLMIAGTYTALLSQLHGRPWTIALGALVWSGALAGAALRLTLPGRLDGLAIAICLALGWSAIFVVRPLAAALPAETLALVVVGGLIYSVGVAFHLWRSLKFQNAIWHSCVAVAAGCHFAGIAGALSRAA